MVRSICKYTPSLWASFSNLSLFYFFLCFWMDLRVNIFMLLLFLTMDQLLTSFTFFCMRTSHQNHHNFWDKKDLYINIFATRVDCKSCRSMVPKQMCIWYMVYLGSKKYYSIRYLIKSSQLFQPTKSRLKRSVIENVNFLALSLYIVPKTDRFLLFW